MVDANLTTERALEINPTNFLVGGYFMPASCFNGGVDKPS
jgi:hypothetical protein